MTLASSGSMSFGGSTIGRSINYELGRSFTSTLDLNDSDARTLATVLSGNISISDFYGKTFFTIGQEEYTFPGTYTWICPEGVSSISVVVVGGGGGGDAGSDLITVGGGGAGGALAYRNNISVVEGQSYQINVGAGGFGQVTVNGTTIQQSTDGESSSAFSCIAGGGKKGTRTSGGIGIGSTTAVGGTLSGVFDGGGVGGAGGTIDTSPLGFRSTGGGGAGGYSGAGGAGARGQRFTGTPTTSAGYSGLPAVTNSGGGGGGGSGYQGDLIRQSVGGNGGGVGIYGKGVTGAGGVGGSSASPAQPGNDGSGGSFGFYGGGGAGGIGTGDNRSANDGVPGAVRIIWPGVLRRFPDSGTQNE
jgi:hypothetical protein